MADPIRPMSPLQAIQPTDVPADTSTCKFGSVQGTTLALDWLRAHSISLNELLRFHADRAAWQAAGKKWSVRYIEQGGTDTHDGNLRLISAHKIADQFIFVQTTPHIPETIIKHENEW